MMGLADIWRHLTGRAEQEAVVRNVNAHEQARSACRLDDDVDEIDRLMRQRRVANGHHKPTSR